MHVWLPRASRQGMLCVVVHTDVVVASVALIRSSVLNTEAE